MAKSAKRRLQRAVKNFKQKYSAYVYKDGARTYLHLEEK